MRGGHHGADEVGQSNPLLLTFPLSQKPSRWAPFTKMLWGLASPPAHSGDGPSREQADLISLSLASISAVLDLSHCADVTSSLSPPWRSSLQKMRPSRGKVHGLAELPDYTRSKTVTTTTS